MRNKVPKNKPEMSNSEVIAMVFTYLLGLVIFGLNGIVMAILFFKAVEANKRGESTVSAIIGIFLCFVIWLISF